MTVFYEGYEEGDRIYYQVDCHHNTLCSIRSGKDRENRLFITCSDTLGTIPDGFFCLDRLRFPPRPVPAYQLELCMLYNTFLRLE